MTGCVAALAAMSAMIMPSVAAAGPKHKIKQTYVALGDSLAFGYSQQLFNENLATGDNPAAFEHGYASDYYNLINGNGRTQFVNDGCPGETTGSLIGNGPELAKIQAVDPAVTGEAPCAYHYAAHLELHNSYGGKSQLESAIETIQTDKAAGRPVKVITLDIGANDQLHKIKGIEQEAAEKVKSRVEALATAQATGEIGDKVKAAAEAEVQAFVIEQVIPQAFAESGGVEPAFIEDIGKDAGEYAVAHHGELSVLLFEDEAKYAAEHGAELAAEGAKLGAEDAAKYVAEHGAELKAEGEKFADEKIIETAPEVGNEIITNTKGIFMALKEAGFKGKLIFEGTYDAFGNDYGTGELLPDSNALVTALNGAEKKAFGKRPVKACYSDAHALFNTETEPSETEHMIAWTNMANMTEFEYAPGKKLKFNEKVEVAPHVVLSADGPDIHATPLGYEKMAEQIQSTCGN